MNSVLNIATYRFVELDDLPTLRDRLLSFCRQLDLKGTILLSEEGINLFLAGSEEAAIAVCTEFDRDPRLAGMDYKKSWSAKQPFGRLKVKIKPEIVTFGQPGISPATAPAPRISPETLKQWLDEGRDIVLLDTRNTFEYDQGAFDGSVHLGNDNFREFAEAVQQMPAETRAKPVVTFCTGGIRCEKAAPYLQHLGFADVYQLDGGILRYFEHVGSAHYRGDCFVFDERDGVDPALKPVAAGA